MASSTISVQGLTMAMLRPIAVIRAPPVQDLCNLLTCKEVLKQGMLPAAGTSRMFMEEPSSSIHLHPIELNAEVQVLHALLE
eukprot:4595817-Amphidinium_carterae.1